MASSSQIRRSRRDALEAQKVADAEKTRRNRILFAVAGILVLALVIAIAAWGIISNSTGGGDDIPPNANANQNGILLAPAVEGAPTLDIFSDFTCTSCKSANLTLNAVIKEIVDEGKVNVVIHPVAVLSNASRNPAIAATCADYAGKFHEYYHQAFIDQDGESGYTDELLKTTIPSEIGLTGDALTAFQTCYADEATGGFVDKATKYYLSLKANGTPAFFLDKENVGEKIWNPSTRSYDPDLLRALIADL